MSQTDAADAAAAATASDADADLIADELSVLSSIYSQPGEFHLISSSEFQISFFEPVESQFTILLPTGYPHDEPIVDLTQLPLDSAEFSLLFSRLTDFLQFSRSAGCICCFELIEKIREFMQNKFAEKSTSDGQKEFGMQKTVTAALTESLDNLLFESEDDNESKENEKKKIEYLSEVVNNENSSNKSFRIPILSGEPLVDRRSTFQAHFARVSSREEINFVRSQLLANPRISRATHNIVAYRCSEVDANSGRTSQFHDNDDDGENAAGDRLAHLLSILGAENCFVMVSRWFGGIKLGNERFKHINEVARKLLESNGIRRQDKAKESTTIAGARGNKGK